MTANVDNLWLAFAALLVLSMQIGFLLLEAGRVRSKNSINVAQKNVSDLVISWLAFMVFGHWLMTDNAIPLAGVLPLAADGSDSNRAILEFLYLLGFCATAASIVSGAIAERMTYRSYLVLAFVTGGLIFPLAGRWIWSDVTSGWGGNWLAELGFVDFAGSTVVHGAGAWVALAAIILIGARIGRFDEDGLPRPIAGHNSVVSLTGALVLLVGWFGFNGGALSTGNALLGAVLLNTAIAATVGGSVGMLLGAWLDHGTFNPPRIINGLLGGLVAITACADMTGAVSAGVVGLLGGMTATLGGQWLLVRWRLDDPVDVVAVHGMAGVVGTLAVAFVAAPDQLTNGSRLVQLGVQVLGILVVFGMAFGLAWFSLKLSARWLPYRVSPEDEHLGLNYTEHGENLGTDRLRKAMEENLEEDTSLDTRFQVEEGDESSELAFAMNQLLDRHEEARMAVHASERRFQDFALTASDWLWETDQNLGVTYFSMEGSERASDKLDAIGRAGLFELVHVRADDVLAISGAVRERRAFGPVDARLKLPGESERLIEIRGRPFRGKTGELIGFRGTFNDVTERRSAERRANFLARHDELTGLANRRALSDDMLGMMEGLAPGRGLVIAAVDLDGFKKTNDAYGHGAGDDLLKAVASRMRDACRTTDRLYRTGGDEFVMLLPGFALDGIHANSAAWCDRLIQTVSEPYDIGGHPVEVSASIGLAMYPEHGAEPDQLVHQADLALYEAKAAGKHCVVVFEPSMDLDARLQIALEAELREAVDQQQFDVEYQPQFDGASGSLSGFEALVRWNHPKRGRVSPAEFISMAERIGLIGDISRFALRRACEFASQWPDVGEFQQLRIAVNVSPTHFEDGRIVDDVNDVLADTGLQPTRLELEITEELLIRDFERVREVLFTLQEMGVSVAIDDFGSGQTSLQYLNQFPISKLKIDRAFVRNLKDDARAQEITQSIVMLGHKLGCTVTAEGIEDNSQADLLRSWHCDQLQGYAYARPLSSSQALGMLGVGLAAEAGSQSATNESQ